MFGYPHVKRLPKHWSPWKYWETTSDISYALHDFTYHETQPAYKAQKWELYKYNGASSSLPQSALHHSTSSLQEKGKAHL